MSDDEADRFMAGERFPSPGDVARAVAGRSVLDLGCGKGKEVKENYAICRYVGVDCSDALVRIARRDNPGFRFDCAELTEYLANLPDKITPVAIMVAVLEHLPSLEVAQWIVREAMRVSEELIIGWHTPPNYKRTEIISVSAELDRPIYQNRYARAAFPAGTVTKVEGGELWSLRS
jgi:trans-aconitate methyltransferase